MRPVINAEQARQITQGRTPLVPIEYETAVKALAECISLDEAKYWNNKADALAAWAKIYRSDEAERKARMLKLHAYRRMGELARELRPGGPKKIYQNKTEKHAAYRQRKRLGLPPQEVPLGEKPGAASLLRESGFSEQRARTILTVSKLPDEVFADAVNQPRPPSPTRLMEMTRDNVLWRDLSMQLHRLRAFMQRNTPSEVAAVVSLDTAATAKELSLSIVEWLDKFELILPKSKQ